MPTYRLDFRYDGTGFRGYARQPGQRTVQEELETALFRITGQLKTTVAGRTDAGVHAAHQVVSFSTDRALDPTRLVKSLNSQTDPDLVVDAASETEPGFDARFTAVSRTYRYVIRNTAHPDPMTRHSQWHISHVLDRMAMQAAALHFVGEHDFAYFCRKAPGRSTHRTLLNAHWEEPEDDLLVFQVTSSSFCHQMVRSLVALSVGVGQGRAHADDVPTIMAQGERATGFGAAPARGLTLWRVSYPHDGARSTT